MSKKTVGKKPVGNQPESKGKLSSAQRKIRFREQQVGMLTRHGGSDFANKFVAFMGGGSAAGRNAPGLSPG